MLKTLTKYHHTLQASSAKPSHGSNTPSLPTSIQDHLGRLLRAEYYERSDKPRYLGDPALPLEFDPYLHELEQKERAVRTRRIRELGTNAIAAALLCSGA
jgi:hypothetical protein